MQEVDEKLKGYSSRLTSAIIGDVQKILDQHNNGFQSMVQQFMAMSQQLYRNDQQLTEKHAELNDQFMILTRLVFSRMNQLIDLQNRTFELGVESLPEGQRPGNVKDHLIPRLTYEEVNELFALFGEFTKRPDFHDHIRAWYTGEDLSKLPPPPPPPEPEAEAKKEEEEEEGAPGEYPEGAQIYGGDYGRTSEDGDSATEAEAKRAAEESGAPNPVPELQGDEDGAEDDSGDHEEGTVVSEL